MERFKDLYKKVAVKSLQEEFNYKNVMQIPRIEKICLNMGVGEAATDSKIINSAVSDLTLISGQKPVITKAKTSNASFKIRKGMSIGCKVTIRKNRMFEFIERLIFIALPRSRDFKGFTLKNFDGRGNLSFGIKEHTVFAEIDYEKTDTTRGLDVTIVTTAATDLEAKKLLSCLYFPFKD